MRAFRLTLGFSAFVSSAACAGRQSSPDGISRAACERDPRFSFVPGGAFVFGSSAAERDAAYRLSAQSAANGADAQRESEHTLRARRFFDDEPLRSERVLRSFCIARRPVTQGEYAEFVRATQHRSPWIDENDWLAQGFSAHSYDEVRAYNWSERTPPRDTEQWPVVLVSLEDALDYARWRGAIDGRTYDLPTREEWEKSARGTDGRIFPWGDAWRPDALHWNGTGIAHPTAVGAFAASRGPYGMEDAMGNTFEWTSSRDGARAVLKGCAFDDLAGFCRAAYQHERLATSRHILIGFRLVSR